MGLVQVETTIFRSDRGNMAKKYKDKEGMYLAIAELRDGFRVGWFDTEENSVEAFTDDSPVPPRDEQPADKSTWENWIAYWAMVPFARDQNGWSEGVPIAFASITAARKALAAANAALLSGSAPWPEWAILAKDAGWKPPTGWKP
jgi:hypothetical protein